MEENNLFGGRYFLERLLGRGNFSEVWLAKDTKTNIQVALKIYAPATGLDDAGLNVLAREFALVVNANHKNLLKPLYYDSFDRKPFLVLPFCKEGSIMKNVGKFTENDAWRLLRDAASGLAWLHGMNPPVIHQDIKPDNIMIGENGDFMITDFGVSTHVKSTLRKSMSAAFSSAGTIAYMAPERFGKDNTPIMANDIYSLGATVYEMLTGDTPFGDDGGLLQMKGAEVPELKGDYSPQLKEVIARCLRTNPWQRPTAEQLERYAEDGLQGKKIVFADHKSVWQRHKLTIILAAAVFVAVIVGTIMFVNDKKDREQQELKALAISIHNDSIQALAKKLVFTADSLVKVGDAHDENFETAYIAAVQGYRNAIALGMELSDGTTLFAKSDIEKKRLNVETKLADTYTSLKEKAVLFSDEPDVEAEFNERLSKIAEVIDITSAEVIDSTNEESALVPVGNLN